MNIVQKQPMQEPRTTEKEYRKLNFLNYSGIKSYIEDPLTFYKEFILGQPSKKEVSKALITGSLVDVLLLSADQFDNYFVLNSTGELDKAKTQMDYFTITLWEFTEQALDESGQLTESFEILCQRAFDASKYDYQGNEVRFKKKDLSYAIEKFEGSDFELWYRTKRDSIGRSLVSVQDMENAEKVIYQFKTSELIGPIVNQETTERYSVYNQLVVLFKLGNLEMKVMLDKVIVDHKKKRVLPFDLKTTWDILNFSYNYTKYAYWIQKSLYEIGLDFWIKQQGLVGYERMPLWFILGHSAGLYEPLLITTTQEDSFRALNGFKVPNGRYYKGLSECLAEIEWRIDQGKWNGPAFNKYQVPLEIDYSNE